MSLEKKTGGRFIIWWDSESILSFKNIKDEIEGIENMNREERQQRSNQDELVAAQDTIDSVVGTGFCWFIVGKLITSWLLQKINQ